MTESAEPGAIVYDLPLLGKDEPPPFTILNPDGKSRVLLTCEHAGSYIPAKLRHLGLDQDDGPDYTVMHYAVDVGARMVTEILSALLDAPAILANYSRLVVDPNRVPEHPTAFVRMGEGRPIPGNITLTDADRQARISEIYEPYHSALKALLDGQIQRHHVPLFISVHSFTPIFFQFRRPWEVGFLWSHDSRVSDHMVAFFAGRGYLAGNNQPYDHRIARGSAINVHADSLGVPGTLLEIRSDLISGEAGAQKWAELVAEAIRSTIATSSLMTIYDGPQTPYDPVLERSYLFDLAERAKKGEG